MSVSSVAMHTGLALWGSKGTLHTICLTSDLQKILHTAKNAKYYVPKASASGGLCAPDPLPELCPWTFVLALDLEGVHDVKLYHPSSSVATSNQ